MPSRDDFSSVTKRTLAQRAGGRCSKPGCDKLCWLPGEGPDQAASIGVAAHINAAAPGGKRFDAEQRRVERKSIANAIYLCHDHAHEIDTDEVRFPAEKLRQWKERHEKQVLGEASGTLLFPSFSLIQHSGISVDTTSPTTVSSSGIGKFLERKLVIKNETDFEFRRFGFTLQYPEFIERDPQVASQPGFSFEINGGGTQLSG